MKPGAPRPRPIVAKFGYFKQKEQVKSRGRELKGTDFGVNDQFPKEILERRKNSVPNPTQSHPKGLPSCHRSGSALRGRTALPQHPYHSVVILTPLQIRIRYIYLFFSLFPRLSPFTSNYLCHFDNVIRYHNKYVQSVSAAFKWFAMFSFLSSFYFHPSMLLLCMSFLLQLFHGTDHLLYYTYKHNTLYYTSAWHDHVHIHSALTQPLRPYSAHRHEGHTRTQARTRPLISYSFEHHTQRAALATHTHLWVH